jgi:transcriptional regulator with XRE-family HTH domain
VNDQRLGAIVRTVRLRRKFRQEDLGRAAGVSRATISLVERGHCESLSLATIRRIAGALDVRVDVVGWWRGGDLDRLLNRRHSLLAESVAARVASSPGWVLEPEVTFSFYGERGVVDQLAWHAQTAHLLVIELKTQLVDINELLGTLDKKRRLACRIAMERGWTPSRTSVWLIVTETCTNRRHAAEHAVLLHSRLQFDGRQFRRLLRDPTSAMSGLAFWSHANPGSARSSSRGRSAAEPGQPSSGKPAPRMKSPSLSARSAAGS